MTGDETCGLFISERVVVVKVAEPMGGRVTRRGGWSHNRSWKGEAYMSLPQSHDYSHDASRRILTITSL